MGAGPISDLLAVKHESHAPVHMTEGVRRQATQDNNGVAVANMSQLTLHMLRWLCSALLPTRDQVTLAWRLYLAILLSSTVAFAAPSRIG